MKTYQESLTVLAFGAVDAALPVRLIVGKEEKDLLETHEGREQIGEHDQNVEAVGFEEPTHRRIRKKDGDWEHRRRRAWVAALDRLVWLLEN